ncbi:hypothetical protein GQ53DRAFT_769537 [Thozetella sp. PMI_491]|nr:hypothetical protein GQ53DRAFT_769537 [Thozetella sp. PMI_491]
MKTIFVISTLFARAGTTRVLMANDNTDTAVQADVTANGGKTSIKSNFGNLGSPVQANRANIVSGSGSCKVFKDAGATQQYIFSSKSSLEPLVPAGSKNLLQAVRDFSTKTALKI